MTPGIRLGCTKCHKAMHQLGGELYGPVDKAGRSRRRVLCLSCYRDLERFLYAEAPTVLEMERAAEEVA